MISNKCTFKEKPMKNYLSMTIDERRTFNKLNKLTNSVRLTTELYSRTVALREAGGALIYIIAPPGWGKTRLLEAITKSVRTMHDPKETTICIVDGRPVTFREFQSADVLIVAMQGLDKGKRL